MWFDNARLMICDRNSLQNANVSTDGMDKRALSSDKALSSPKLQIFIVLMTHDKYMHLIADLTDAICHLKSSFIQVSITR